MQGWHSDGGTCLGVRYLQISSPKSVSSKVNMKSITMKRYRSCPTHVSQHWGDSQVWHRITEWFGWGGAPELISFPILPWAETPFH